MAIGTHGSPLQYSRLENPMDRGAWWAAVHGVDKSRTRLSDFSFTFYFHAFEKAAEYRTLIDSINKVIDRQIIEKGSRENLDVFAWYEDKGSLQYSCLKSPMDGGAWWAAVHGVVKSRTRLSVFTFTFHFHALQKEMAAHSSVLAWRIPGMGEPGGL